MAWRIVVSLLLVTSATICFLVPVADFRYEMDPLPFLPRLAGAVLLGGAIGTPFKKGLLFALCTPVALFFAFAVWVGLRTP
jgi:hypothetical protein